MLRKLTTAIALTGLIAVSAYAANNDPQSGINGSRHDMNTWAGAGATPDVYGRTCVFCHTPHNARGADADPTHVNSKPLWNRADNTWNQSPYGWVTPLNISVDGTNYSMVFNDDPLIGPSRLCMTCHDGSIAVDSHLSNGSQAGTMKLTAARRSFVTNLAVTHPIGFKYSDAITARGLGELVPATDGFIAAPSASLNSTTFNTQSRGALAKSNVKIADTLYKAPDGFSYMTCATCHDVHNTVNAKSDTGAVYNMFLRAREEGSAICLSCHIK